MKTVYIVTGAAGHLGGSIVKILTERKKEVRALVLPNESCRIGSPCLTEYTGDVCDPLSLDRLFEGGHEFVMIHCAGLISINSKSDARVLRVNVDGTKNVVDACRRNGAKRMVYISSVHAIPEKPRGEIMPEITDFSPESVVGCYAKTKAMATKLVLEAAEDGLDAVVVHPAGIIGPNGLLKGNIVHLIVNFLSGKLPAAVKGGFDFVDVRDVAAGVVAAAEKGRKGECYILSNRYIELSEFFDTLSEVSGRRRLKHYMPMWFTRMIAPFAELFYKITGKTPLFTLYSLHTLSQNASYSHEKATRELGYKTRSLKESLYDTVVWLRKSGIVHAPDKVCP